MARAGCVCLAAALLAGCGARSSLEVGVPSDAGEVRLLDGDAGADMDPDAAPPVLDASVDEPSCAWGPGMVGAWRLSSASAQDLASIFHVDESGRVRVTTVSDEPGAAFGMGIAVRDGALGVSWRVRRDDGTNLIRHAIVRGGCVVGAPHTVYAGDTVQSFRGGLVATTAGWLVFWVADGGLWMRALDPAGAPLGDPRAVSPIADARFAVAGRGDRAGVVYVEDGVVQLAELASDGAVVRTSSISDPSVVATEPRLVALRSGGWAGTYLANDTLYAFETGAGITPVGPACTPCVSDPSYLLPAVATDGEHLAVLWPRDDAGERELVWAIVGPGAPTPVVIARGANVRWPALGFDGRRWVAVHDEGAGLVRVQRLPPGEGSAGIDTRTVPGSQRLPSLVRVP